MNEAKDIKGLFIEIPKDFHKQLKAHAAMEDKSMKDIIILAVKEYLEKQ